MVAQSFFSRIENMVVDIDVDNSLAKKLQTLRH